MGTPTDHKWLALPRWIFEVGLCAYISGPILILYLVKMQLSFLLFTSERLANWRHPPVMQRADYNFETQIIIDFLWCAATSAVLLLVRLASLLPLARTALRRLGGPVAVLFFPLYWLYFPGLFTGLPALSRATTLFLSGELLCASLFMLSYALSRKKPSLRRGVVALVLHFGLWFVVTEPNWNDLLFFHHPYKHWVTWTQGGSLFLILGFTSAVAWWIYVRQLPKSNPGTIVSEKEG